MKVKHAKVVRIQTIAMQGMDAVIIDVQVQMNAGIPRFTIVGLPDAVVSESKIRITSALTACLPPSNIVVNLSPANIRKEGNHYDLPIALCLLVAMNIIPENVLENFIALGGLSLDGEIVSVCGVLPAAIQASAIGKKLICPRDCIETAMLAGDDLKILAPSNLLELINLFKNNGEVLTNNEYASVDRVEKSVDHDGNIGINSKDVDWSQIKGQESAKRAALIALSGGHHLLMIGSPGSGKSMLAHSLKSLLPDMNSDVALETTIIHNLRGNINGRLVIRPPFREPHHGASMAALIGGGQRLLPGDVSLANGGILFMDEFPEFNRQVLDSLREPMETGFVTVARASGSIKYPAHFQLVAAMNPCKCGTYDEKACATGVKCKQLYMARISGPLLDRFDICVKTKKLMPWELINNDMNFNNGVSDEFVMLNSSTAKKLIALARDIQFVRQGCLNVNLSNSQINNMIQDQALRLFLEILCKKYELSGRGYYRMLRVARTIADLHIAQEILLEQKQLQKTELIKKDIKSLLKETIDRNIQLSKEYILEAVSYRMNERQ